jgi:hypothetical protein
VLVGDGPAQTGGLVVVVNVDHELGQVQRSWVVLLRCT